MTWPSFNVAGRRLDSRYLAAGGAGLGGLAAIGWDMRRPRKRERPGALIHLGPEQSRSVEASTNPGVGRAGMMTASERRNAEAGDWDAPVLRSRKREGLSLRAGADTGLSATRRSMRGPLSVPYKSTAVVPKGTVPDPVPVVHARHGHLVLTPAQRDVERRVGRPLSAQDIDDANEDLRRHRENYRRANNGRDMSPAEVDSFYRGWRA